MKKKSIVFLMLLSLIPLATNTFAAGNKAHTKEAKASYKATGLQLSQEEESALYIMTTEYLRDRQPIKKELAQKQAEYKALMRHTNPNVKQAGALAAEISTLEYTLMDMSMRYHKQIGEQFKIPMSNCSNGGCPDHKSIRASAH